MIDPTTAWLNALIFMAGYGAAELQHWIRKHLKHGGYFLPPNHDWRLSEPQRCIDYHEFLVSPPPIRFDEGRVQRGNGGNNPATPKPDIIPKPQSPSPRVIPGDTP